MMNPTPAPDPSPGGGSRSGEPEPAGQRRALGGAVTILGILALLVPLWPELAPEHRLGTLLIATAAIEFFHGFRRADAAGRRAAWVSGALTATMGGLLMNAPALVGGTVLVLLAGWFALDAIRWGLAAARDWRERRDPRWSMLAAVGNLAILAFLLVLGHLGVLWALSIAAALRIFGTAANIGRAFVWEAHDAGDAAVVDLALPGHPELRALGDTIEEEEDARRPANRYWILTFVLTLFAIHLGRMGPDRTRLGIVSPGFAVLGDLVVALGIGWGIIVPLRVLVRRCTRPLERRAWLWSLAVPSGTGGWADGWPRRWVRWWLVDRLRFAVRLRQARFSLRTALGRGLRLGLPAAAVLAATAPIWGMSWYFDTENYAAGIWNSWAEARTDPWREAMIRAVVATEKTAGRPEPTFSVQPPGVAGGGDFAFVVIGDTGEGDASQHVLRDQLILAAAQPEVRFVVISSDVIYPGGAMRDYEARFWLPFKGVTKPVYAIPGNHDWFDALEGFAATFFEPDAARTAMRARLEADPQLTRASDPAIERSLAEAARLRREYRVPTGFQQGPMFQLQTDRFALFAVDTGVRKRIDAAEMAWFKAALDSARGKFKMVILGHPLYACGEYRARHHPDFAEIHRLLRAHDVRIVMAGDTHDLEYYREATEGAPDRPPMHHFVNGGGGAFLTMGAQLADPAAFPTPQWAFYPARGPLVAKVERFTAFWKRPLWWWTRDFRAWPSAPEWLSAAFDYNSAPFFQSFVEVRVEPSAGRVRLLPWGIHGRLRWSDFQTSEGLRPADVPAEAPVEWTFDLGLSP